MQREIQILLKYFFLKDNQIILRDLGSEIYIEFFFGNYRFQSEKKNKKGRFRIFLYFGWLRERLVPRRWVMESIRTNLEGLAYKDH